MNSERNADESQMMTEKFCTVCSIFISNYSILNAIFEIATLSVERPQEISVLCTVLGEEREQKGYTLSRLPTSGLLFL